jgi:hypothetical protein
MFKHNFSNLTGDTIKAILLVCLAVGVVGISYGSLAMAYGFPLWVPLALSTLVWLAPPNSCLSALSPAAAIRWRRRLPGCW